LQTGLNSFVLTPKQWIEKIGAVGLTSAAIRQMQVLTSAPALKQLEE